MRVITYEQAVEAKKVLLAWLESRNLGYESLENIGDTNKGRNEYLLYIALTSQYFLD